MVVARLAILAITFAGDAADVDEGDAVAQESRKGHLFRLERGVGKLNPERDAKTFALRRIEGQGPNRIEIQPSWTRLHVSPIAANVEDAHEGQAGNLLYVLLKSLPACACGQGWPTLFPGIANQAQTRIAQWFFGWCGEEYRLPSLVLIYVKGTLIQALSRRPARTDFGILFCCRKSFRLGESR